MTAAATEAEILNAGAAGLAALYRAGRTDPVGVLDGYLDRIARLDGQVHAYVHLTADAARAAAADSAARWRAGRPLSDLDGVPIAVKANIALAGAPWHAGIGAYRDRIAATDALCVANLKAAGAVITGLVNMHEGALGATTDNVWFGRTHNPLRHGFTAGGSSGGSGAVVAAGLAAGALGTDTMGSVRIPSAYCGIAGYKPSLGLIPTDGVVALSVLLDHVGPHARSIADCALIAAHAAGRPDLARLPDVPARPRIGLLPDLRARVDAPAEVWAAEDRAAAALRAAGAELVPLPLADYDPGRLRRLGLLVSEAEGAVVHADALAATPDGFGAEFRGMLDWAARQPATKLAGAYMRLTEVGRQLRALMAGVDAILLPTTPQAAFSFDDPVPANQADFTAIADFAGCAAACVPQGTAANGLPLSVQLMGLDDSRVLALAAAL